MSTDPKDKTRDERREPEPDRFAWGEGDLMLEVDPADKDVAEEERKEPDE